MSEQIPDNWDSFDKKIAGALLEMPVPAGLEDRLLARITAAQGAVSGNDQPSGTAPARSAAPRRISRRRWLALAGSVAASVALAVGISTWPREEKVFSLVELLDLAPTWVEQLQSNETWQSPQRLPQNYLPSRALNAGIMQWRDAAQLVGRSAVAYSLASASGKQATLLVIGQTERIAASTPPVTPQSTTLGLMIGCWQQGDLVYVLLVEGRERDYREFISAGSRPSVT